MLKDAHKNYKTTSAITMIILCIAGVMSAVFLSGKAIKPLSNLNKKISEIDESKLDEHIDELTGNDEIAQLTSSFNRMLDRLNKSFVRQKRFSANAAHELKTPVAIIKTALETLELDKPAIEDYQEANEIISRNTERLSKVIDDLMMLTNTAVPEKETFDLCETLTEISNNISQKYKEKCVKIRFDFPKDGVEIIAPKGFTERIFANIIENAIKYNYDYGNININVSNNELLTVKISDDGIGILPENLAHIWEPFYCADRSRARKFGGAGLGLSIVKDISEQLGWKISVKSEKEKGTEFTIIIDLLQK